MTTPTFPSEKACTVSKLLGLPIVCANGYRLGHVANIQFTVEPPYRVTALLYGRQGWFHRLHILNLFTWKHSAPWKPASVPWTAVARIEEKRILLKKME